MEIHDSTSLLPPTPTCISPPPTTTTALSHPLHPVAVTAEKPSSSASVR